MNWLKVILILIALMGAALLVYFSFSVRLVKVPSFDPPSLTRLALNNLSREQKIGQRFIIGFQGTSVTPALESKIKNLHPGGVLLLGRNIENEQQLKKMTEELQEIALEDTGLPLLIAVDQEGEPLCRIDWLDCVAPSEINEKDRAYEVGLKRGKELRKLGVNLNLAPALDKSHLGDFVYPRTFHSEHPGEEGSALRSSGDEVKALQAGELAASFIDGQKENVLNALKHFPGYTTIDFNPEREKLAELNFIPDTTQFKVAMRADPAMVMVSNVVYTQLSNSPLSLDADGIEFVRDELRPGLIISDDLSSPVLKEEYGLKETISRAAEAGVDFLLVAGFDDVEDPERAIKHLKEEDVDVKRLNKSLLKIIELKRNLNEKNN